MEVRKILVPLAGGELDDKVLATAFKVAENFEARVVGLFVRPDPAEALPYVGDGVSGRVIEDILTAVKEGSDAAAARAKQSLSKAAETAGVPLVEGGDHKLPSARFVDMTGHAADVVASESRLSDLVVFGYGAEASEAGGGALEAALMSAGRPVLIAPQTPPMKIGGTIAIGWDNSFEASHAVTSAMPFLAKAKNCVILRIDGGEASTEAGSTLADYLALYGITAEVREVHGDNRDKGEVLLEETASIGADLLVMGGYGHSRFREFLVGGVTRHVRSHGIVPVLMAH